MVGVYRVDGCIFGLVCASACVYSSRTIKALTTWNENKRRNNFLSQPTLFQELCACKCVKCECVFTTLLLFIKCLKCFNIYVDHSSWAGNVLHKPFGVNIYIFFFLLEMIIIQWDSFLSFARYKKGVEEKKKKTLFVKITILNLFPRQKAKRTGSE